MNVVVVLIVDGALLSKTLEARIDELVIWRRVAIVHTTCINGENVEHKSS